MARPNARFDRPYTRAVQQTQELPFTLRLARTEDDVERVARQRAQAYGKHQPDLVERLSLSLPESEDLRDDAVILMAESRQDGSVVGSLRLTTNINTPLRFEKEFSLDARFQNRPMLEAGRMTAAGGVAGRMVVPALIKVTFEICYRTGIDYLLLIARSPIDRMYKAMQFQDMFGRKVVTSAQPGVPVTLFFMDILQVDTRFQAHNVAVYPFMAETEHPDIDIDHQTVFKRFNVPHQDASLPREITSPA